jgi:hypothetical protein
MAGVLPINCSRSETDVRISPFVVMGRVFVPLILHALFWTTHNLTIGSKYSEGRDRSACVQCPTAMSRRIEAHVDNSIDTYSLDLERVCGWSPSHGSLWFPGETMEGLFSHSCLARPIKHFSVTDDFLFPEAVSA